MAVGMFSIAIAFSLLCNIVSADISPPRAEKLAEDVQDTKLLKPKENQEKWDTVAAQLKEAGGCGPNVCFALDGSESIPPKDYELQKNFVQLVAAIVGGDPNAMFAAAQYGREIEIITGLTKNAEGFLIDVTQSNFLKAPATFIEPGVLFCNFQLGKQAGEPAKMVILGDGRSNVVDRTRAKIAVQQFKNANPKANEVCAVGVGFKNENLLEEIVGRADRVLEVTEWPVILNILDRLVEEICQVKLPPPVVTTKPPVTTKPKCPCECFEGSGRRPDRKSRRLAKQQCKAFKGQCAVVTCPGPSLRWKCC